MICANPMGGFRCCGAKIAQDCKLLPGQLKAEFLIRRRTVLREAAAQQHALCSEVFLALFEVGQR